MADKAFQEALQAEATSWLKWWPDYNLASMKYEQAAKSYRHEGKWEKAKEAYLKASQAHEQASG